MAVGDMKQCAGGAVAVGQSWGGTIGTRPSYSYEQAADAWKAARERRDRAKVSLDGAQHEFQEASKNEADCWSALESEAGRDSPPATTASVRAR